MSIRDKILSVFSSDLFLELHREKVTAYNYRNKTKTAYSASDETNGMGLFSHPRVLIESLSGAQDFFRKIIGEESPRCRVVNPLIYVQIMIPLEGGVSELESFALVQSLQVAGARDVFIVNHDSPLSQSEIEELKSVTYGKSNHRHDVIEHARGARASIRQP